MSIGFAAAGLVAATWSIGVAQEPSRNFIIHQASKPVAAIQFEDADGRSRSLANFGGKIVLLNASARFTKVVAGVAPGVYELVVTVHPEGSTSTTTRNVA